MPKILRMLSFIRGLKNLLGVGLLHLVEIPFQEIANVLPGSLHCAVSLPHFALSFGFRAEQQIRKSKMRER